MYLFNEQSESVRNTNKYILPPNWQESFGIISKLTHVLTDLSLNAAMFDSSD